MKSGDGSWSRVDRQLSFHLCRPLPCIVSPSLSFSLSLWLLFLFFFFLATGVDSASRLGPESTTVNTTTTRHCSALAGNLITCLTNHRSEMFFAWNRDVVIFWNSPHKKQKIPHIIRISFVLHHVALSSCSSPSSGWKTFFSEGGISGFFCYHRRIRNYHMIIMNVFFTEGWREWDL